jgi:hypothetical protein
VFVFVESCCRGPWWCGFAASSRKPTQTAPHHPTPHGHITFYSGYGLDFLHPQGYGAGAKRTKIHPATPVHTPRLTELVAI